MNLLSFFAELKRRNVYDTWLSFRAVDFNLHISFGVYGDVVESALYY